ncbi:MAG: 2'-5' RNA ligase [Maribacter sp.]|jgi:2'-5' RNA ligase
MKLTIWLYASGDTELPILIQHFSNTLNAPVFIPHITLLGSVEIDDPLPYLEAVAHISNDLNTLKIYLDGIAFEELIWRCFYYKVHPKETLLAYHKLLVSQLEKFGASKSEYFMPHLSLIYQNLTLTQQEELLEKNKALLASRSLIFNTIKVVHFIPDDIENWEVLASFPLKPSLES